MRGVLHFNLTDQSAMESKNMILLNSDACFREHKIKGILRKLIEIVCRWDRLCASVSVNSSPELGVSEDADHASWSAGKVSLVTSVNPLFDPASIYECDQTGRRR